MNARAGRVVLFRTEVTGNSVVVENGHGNGRGGGLYSLYADITIRGSTINGNSLSFPSFYYGYGFGGGISTSSLKIANSSVSGNEIEGAGWARGGGIFANGLDAAGLTVASNAIRNALDGAGGGIFGAVAGLVDSTISGNSVTSGNALGGGIAAAYGGISLAGSRVVENSVVAGEHSAIGGGIFMFHSDSTLQNSIISGNSAVGFPGRGGGVVGGYGQTTLAGMTVSDNEASHAGGGVWGRGLLLSNSTISGNSSQELGGGIFLDVSATLNNSTITDNSAPFGGGIATWVDFTMNSSIVFGNTSTDDSSPAADIYAGSSAATAVTGTANLVGVSALALPMDTVATDPQLGPLADNGGPTFTHALPASSFAIDRGANPDGLATDQRGAGYPRVFGTQADIGAFEYASMAIFSDGFE